MRNFIIALALLASTFSGGITMAADQSVPVDSNVLGQPLQSVPNAPAGTPAGFYRNGYCSTGADDTGSHVVASTMTQEFLDFTKSQGNDLQTPRPEHNFPGLQPGDGWCVCAARWKEAEAAGVAPPVDLDATHESAMSVIPLETLQKYQQKQ
jgi:uncharacterized protein (DUF2237 family)